MIDAVLVVFAAVALGATFDRVTVDDALVVSLVVLLFFLSLAVLMVPALYSEIVADVLAAVEFAVLVEVAVDAGVRLAVVGVRMLVGTVVDSVILA